MTEPLARDMPDAPPSSPDPLLDALDPLSLDAPSPRPPPPPSRSTAKRRQSYLQQQQQQQFQYPPSARDPFTAPRRIVPPTTTRPIVTGRTGRTTLPRGTSPRKQTFELEVGDDRAPQRLFVTVEADDYYDGGGNARVGRRLFGAGNTASPSAGAGIRRREMATTTRIPLKDEGSTALAGAGTPRRRGRPPGSKSRGTPGRTPAKGARRKSGVSPVRNNATPKRPPGRPRKSAADDADPLLGEGGGEPVDDVDYALPDQTVLHEGVAVDDDDDVEAHVADYTVMDDDNDHHDHGHHDYDDNDPGRTITQAADVAPALDVTPATSRRVRRPGKRKLAATDDDATAMEGGAQKKRRGRPPKARPSIVAAETSVETSAATEHVEIEDAPADAPLYQEPQPDERPTEQGGSVEEEEYAYDYGGYEPEDDHDDDDFQDEPQVEVEHQGEHYDGHYDEHPVEGEPQDDYQNGYPDEPSDQQPHGLNQHQPPEYPQYHPQQGRILPSREVIPDSEPDLWMDQPTPRPNPVSAPTIIAREPASPSPVPPPRGSSHQEDADDTFMKAGLMDTLQDSNANHDRYRYHAEPAPDRPVSNEHDGGGGEGHDWDDYAMDVDIDDGHHHLDSDEMMEDLPIESAHGDADDDDQHDDELPLTSDGFSDADAEGDTPRARRCDLDTIAQGEEFSMIFMDSIQSLQAGGGGKVVSAAEELGDETSLIINNTLQSLRQSRENAMREAERGDELQEQGQGSEARAEDRPGSSRRSGEPSKSPLPPGSSPPRNRPSPPHPHPRPTLTHASAHRLQPRFSIGITNENSPLRRSPKRPRRGTLGGRLLDSFVQSSATAAQSPKASGGGGAGDGSYQDDSNVYEDSFSAVPSRILEAATPRPPRAQQSRSEQEVVVISEDEDQDEDMDEDMDIREFEGEEEYQEQEGYQEEDEDQEEDEGQPEEYEEGEEEMGRQGSAERRDDQSGFLAQYSDDGNDDEHGHDYYHDQDQDQGEAPELEGDEELEGGQELEGNEVVEDYEMLEGDDGFGQDDNEGEQGYEIEQEDYELEGGQELEEQEFEEEDQELEQEDQELEEGHGTESHPDGPEPSPRARAQSHPLTPDETPPPGASGAQVNTVPPTTVIPPTAVPPIAVPLAVIPPAAVMPAVQSIQPRESGSAASPTAQIIPSQVARPPSSSPAPLRAPPPGPAPTAVPGPFRRRRAVGSSPTPASIGPSTSARVPPSFAAPSRPSAPNDFLADEQHPADGDGSDDAVRPNTDHRPEMPPPLPRLRDRLRGPSKPTPVLQPTSSPPALPPREPVLPPAQPQAPPAIPIVSDGVTRPTLSPIVRAGRALQHVTSDPPTPVAHPSLLGSPFRRGAENELALDATALHTMAPPPRFSFATSRAVHSRTQSSSNDVFGPGPTIPRPPGRQFLRAASESAHSPGRSRGYYGGSRYGFRPGSAAAAVAAAASFPGPADPQRTGWSGQSSRTGFREARLGLDTIPDIDVDVEGVVDIAGAQSFDTIPATASFTEDRPDASSRGNGGIGERAAERQWENQPLVDDAMEEDAHDDQGGGQYGGQDSENGEGEDEEEEDDIWAVEASRPTPHSKRNGKRPESALPMPMPISGRFDLPRPWARQTLPRQGDAEARVRDSSINNINKNKDNVEEFSLISQNRKDPQSRAAPSSSQEHDEPIPAAAPHTAKKTLSTIINMSDFFSSPANLPPLLGGGGPESARKSLAATAAANAAANRAASRAPARTQRLQANSNSMFPTIPQKKFTPSKAGRVNLFSSPAAKSSVVAPSSSLRDHRSSVPSSPVRDTPGIASASVAAAGKVAAVAAKALSSVAQKLNFGSRVTVTEANPDRDDVTIRPALDPAPNTEDGQATPPRVQLSRGDIERWRDETSSSMAEDDHDDAMNDGTFDDNNQECHGSRANGGGQYLMPRTHRDMSPGKSCLRSPLKPKTPGRVVEFTSSTLSPLAQTQQREQQRVQQQPLYYDLTIDEEEEGEEEEGEDGDDPTQEELDHVLSQPQPPQHPQPTLSSHSPRSRPPLAPTQPTTSSATTTSPTKRPAPEPLSQSTWSRAHWVLLNHLVQLRRRGPFPPPSHPPPPKPPPHPLLGKIAHSQGERMALEQWHLDVVDAFRAEVGGWDERYLAKRVFALLVGEERRRTGKILSGGRGPAGGGNTPALRTAAATTVRQQQPRRLGGSGRVTRRTAATAG